MKTILFICLTVAISISTAEVAVDLSEDKIRHVEYGPNVVTLTGSIVEEAYPEDSAPMNRGRKALIFRLDRPISVQAKPNDDINVAEWLLVITAAACICRRVAAAHQQPHLRENEDAIFQAIADAGR